MFPTTPTDYDPRRYWGVGATLFWVALILLISTAVEFRVLWAVYSKTILGSPTDDLNPAVASFCASIVVVTTCTVVAIVLRRGAPIGQYLAIRAAHWRRVTPQLVFGGVVSVGAIWIRLTPATEADAHLLDQDLLAVYLALVFIGVPLVEEALFRGFAISGFLTSRWGAVLAVPLSAALWALSHTVLSWTGYAALFAVGCVLGVLRVRSGSIWPPLALHAATNAGAFLVVLPRAL